MDALPDLTPLEQTYQEKFLILFAQVDAKQPEKGIRTLFLRAREKARQEGISHQDALEDIYHGALERTERRVQLLASCELMVDWLN